MTIKIFTSIFFALLLYQQLPAQKNNNSRVALTGKITLEKTGLPLPGATIYISDLKLGATADESGNYILRNIPAGTYIIEVGFVGYKKIEKTISMIQNMISNFMM